MNLWKLVVYIKDELFLALGTASTEVSTVQPCICRSVPLAAVALLLGAHQMMDSIRVSVNLLGNYVATLVVANLEGQLDVNDRAVVASR